MGDLLIAGKTTNFIYKILGLSLTENYLDEINSIESRNKIKDRIAHIKNQGGKFEFVKTERKIFLNNLVLIDSLLPEILS